MALQTLKIQNVINTIKTWSLPEQLELIRAITQLLQGRYALNGSERTQVTSSSVATDDESWLQLSQSGLNNAFSEDEPEYTLDMIQEPNPFYEAR